MTTRACTRCGAIAQLFGHRAICAACRDELWTKERDRLAEAKALHPAGKNLPPTRKRRLPLYGSSHTCTPFCHHEILRAVREEGDL